MTLNYNSDLCNFIENTDICFICHEFTCDNGNKPFKLKEQTYYLKTCSCDGFIHRNCLDIWYNRSQKCPICREFVIDKKLFDVIILNVYINNINYLIKDTFGLIMIGFHIKNYIKFISNYFLSLFAFYGVYIIYQEVYRYELMNDKF